MIRLIALDLDGTLLGPDFRISEADQQAPLHPFTATVSSAPILAILGNCIDLLVPMPYGRYSRPSPGGTCQRINDSGH